MLPCSLSLRPRPLPPGGAIMAQADTVVLSGPEAMPRYH
jgi:hypothetical protein